MNEKISPFMKYVSKYNSINELNDKFIASISKAIWAYSDAGSICLDDDSIQIEFMGKHINSIQNKVFRGDSIIIEYVFLSKHKEEDLKVAILYLSMDEVLYKDASCKEVLCDYGNTYILENVFSHVCESVVTSKLFKPYV